MDKTHRARTLLGSNSERLLAEIVSRIGFLADISAFHHRRKTLEGYVFGVGICRARPLCPSRLGLGKLNFHRARQNGDDFVLRLQQIGAWGVELFSPKVRAAASVDELGVDPDLIATWLHRALENIAHAQILADHLGVDRLALVSHGRIARDHKHAGDGARHAREARGQFISERVDNIILRRIAAEVGEGHDNDGKTGGLGRL